jgi:hypothetical protein
LPERSTAVVPKFAMNRSIAMANFMKLVEFEKTKIVVPEKCKLNNKYALEPMQYEALKSKTHDG